MWIVFVVEVEWMIVYVFCLVVSLEVSGAAVSSDLVVMSWAMIMA